jgi:hypothetical protein
MTAPRRKQGHPIAACRVHIGWAAERMACALPPYYDRRCGPFRLLQREAGRVGRNKPWPPVFSWLIN